MRLRRSAIVLVCVLLAGACSGDRSPVPLADGSSTTSPAASSTSAVPAVADVGGEWVLSLPTFDDGGVESVEGVTMELIALSVAGDSYFATGDIVGRPAIWRSAELGHFEVVYLDDRAGGVSRWMRLDSIVEFGGRIVAGGAGQEREGVGERIERSFLFVSDDHGDTWREIDVPLFSEEHQRLDRLVVAGDSLIVDVVNDECCGQPVWRPHRTVDLISWEPIELPAAAEDTWGYLVGDGLGTTFAIESRWDDGPQLVVWSSVDGGRTWDRVELPIDAGRGLAAVAGGITVLPDYGYGELGPEFLDILSPTRIVADTVTDLEADVGQWGDASARLLGLNVSGSGQFYGLVNRQLRANPHYCFEDIDTCHSYEAAFVTSTDGLTWFDIEHPGIEPYSRPELFLTADGAPAYWTAERDEPISIEYWSGPGAPPTLDPPGYALPVAPIPMFTRDEGLPVGLERRFAWGLGGCGGMYIDDISWVATEEFDIDGWPIEQVSIADGPSSYAYGRVHRVAERTIEFSIENSDIVVTLTPRVGEPEGVCG